ncbi:MAG: response regulator [Deltaproteobacteria bacterium]|nr:response regulator [Deltaproteobacteria bacterium]MBW1873412.1 response regulator [Deltaproteobacteria bacterium]
MQVLYVEDDQASQQLIKKGLEKEGFEIFLADSGLAAIEMLKKYRFDALILDIMLPGIDGFQVGRSTRKESKNKDIAIILLSAHPYALREYDAKWLKPIASLTKPVRFEKLIKALNSAKDSK